MKKVYIVRGVSGAGKSTKARELVGETGKIHSTDDFFMVEGVYVFKPEKLHANHIRNYSSFVKSLEAGISPVIVDNTNTRKWEYEKYEEKAKKLGYDVEIVCIPHPDPKVAAERNTHGVPEEVIRKMIARWEA